MKGLYEKKIELVKQMPPVYCEIVSPDFEGYFKVELNTWSMEKNDYVQIEKDAYFDRKHFYLWDISSFDFSDWISNWCHSSLDIVNPIYAQRFYGTDKWNKDVEKGLRSHLNYKGVEDPIKFKELWG